MQHYLTVIAEKTGSLIATAGRYGGMFSGCTPEQVEALRRFGATIGTAFQISDDVIDIASPSDSSGKTPGTDLREGVHTLPMLYAMQGDGRRRRPAARRCWPARSATTPRSTRRWTLLRDGPGLARARAVLAEHAGDGPRRAGHPAARARPPTPWPR